MSSIKEYVFGLKYVLALYLTLMLPIFAFLILAYFGTPPEQTLTLNSDPVYTSLLLFGFVYPIVGGICWIFISLFFTTTSIFYFFIELFLWLITTKNERANNPDLFE